MRAVHKFIVSNGNPLDLPWGSRVLCAQVQRDEICLWVECNPDERSYPVQIYIIGTGNYVPTAAVNYVGTVQMPPYVWHVYTGALPV